MRSNSDNNDGEVYEILFEGNVNCIDNPTTNTQSVSYICWQYNYSINYFLKSTIICIYFTVD